MKPAILDAYREQIESGLSHALRGGAPLRSLLRYHVGLEDEAGMPTHATGKLLRPSIVLFIAEQLGGTVERALPSAVALELIHGFSLIHDDIQDRDRTRRGRPAVWTVCGVEQAINAGDLMHTLAACIALDASSTAAGCLLGATLEMIEGQCLDLKFERRSATTEEYLAMIDRKTGALLRCAFELGGISANADEQVLSDLVALGHAVGRAFQIKDDLLGIWGDEATLGKAIGSDIRRRKKTLPVVWLLEQANDEDRAMLAKLYNNEPSDASIAKPDVEWVIERLDALEARVSCEQMVHDNLAEANDKLQQLPFSENGKSKIHALIHFLARREA